MRSMNPRFLLECERKTRGFTILPHLRHQDAFTQPANRNVPTIRSDRIVAP